MSEEDNVIFVELGEPEKYISIKEGYAKCSHCGYVKPIKYFKINSSWCNLCNRKYRIDYKRRTSDEARVQRMAFIKQLGGKCENCGNTDIRVLCVHHPDGRPENVRGKKGKVDSASRIETYQKQYEDGMKLQILCQNCHIIWHSEHGHGMGIYTNPLYDKIGEDRDYQEGYDFISKEEFEMHNKTRWNDRELMVAKTIAFLNITRSTNAVSIMDLANELHCSEEQVISIIRFLENEEQIIVLRGDKNEGKKIKFIGLVQ